MMQPHIDLRDLPSPEECRGLEDVRMGIDGIDAEIIRLLGKRMGYVLKAADFKPDEASIPAPDRVARMLPARRGWAEKANLDPDFIVPLYSQIIQWFIQQQIKFYKSRSS